MHTPPHPLPKPVLTFLRDIIGVKNLGKVVTSSPTLLLFSLEALIERVKTLEALGVVVDGNFVETYDTHLNPRAIAMREKAKALETVLGPRCFLKHPLVFNVNKRMTKRVAHLQAILGVDQAREFSGKHPIILLSRKARVKEMWSKFKKLFPANELMTQIKCTPQVLGPNSYFLKFEFEYLAGNGLSESELLSDFSTNSTHSLEHFIRPRVDLAIRGHRTHENHSNKI